MRKNIPKSVSNIDLKLLDVKFMAIDDNQIYLTEALQSVRRAKANDFSLLLQSKNSSFLQPKKKQKNQQQNDIITGEDRSMVNGRCMNRSTMQSTEQLNYSLPHDNLRTSQFSLNQSEQRHSPPRSIFSQHYAEQIDVDQIERLKEEIKLRKQTKNQNQIKPRYIQKSQSTLQLKELQKYRRKIQQVKKENLSIHSQISSIYRNKPTQNVRSFKKIKKIELFKTGYLQQFGQQEKTLSVEKNHLKGKTSILSETNQSLKIPPITPSSLLKTKQLTSSNNLSRQSSCQVTREIMNFYENLNEHSPFKEQLQNIHKKMTNNPLLKNFKQYLQETNKRVPEFIKKLRN